MVFQYQYQYQLQRGLGLITYDSFSQLLHDTYSNPILLSFVVAVVPLLLFAFRKRIVKTGVYQSLHALYIKRKKEKQLKQARGEFEETFLGRERRDLFTLLLVGFTVLLGGLIFTQSLFFVAITSNSMAPTFWQTDLVLMQSISKDYQKDDIVVFQNPQVIYKDKVIHRIASIDEDSIKTKGDNNNYADEGFLKKENILGSAVTFNGNPIVAKKVGRYFIKDYDPFKEQDPAYRFLRRSMSNIHTYGPLYLIVILMFILLTQLQEPERSKIY
ncbi:MAG: signal peptidase I [Candidatus Hydrothermarchaeales archaeon]